MTIVAHLLVTSCLNESNERLDPKKCGLGLRLESDTVYGFPVLNRVEPTSPLRTQIPMSMQRNCWVVAINSKKNGHIEPITAKFLVDKLKLCQTPGSETKIQITFHHKIKPVTTKLQTLRAMSDQMDTNTPIVRHVVAMPEKPSAPRSIHLCLKDKHRDHWKASLFHQYDKNADMLLLSEPVARESLPPDTKFLTR